MKLKAPNGVSSFSHDGELYEVKKGVIDVEGEAIAVAMFHGFTDAKVKGDDKDDAAAQAEAEAKAKEEAEAAELAALEAEEAAAAAAAAEAEGKK